MDVKKYIILLKDEDKTADIVSLSEPQEGYIRVDFTNGSYSYKQENVVIITCDNPAEIPMDGKTPYFGNMPVLAPLEVLDFGERIRVVQPDGKGVSGPADTFLLVENSATKPGSREVLQYLQDIAQYTASAKEGPDEGTETETATQEPEDQAPFLLKEIEQLTFIHPESVLGSYLEQQPPKLRDTDMGRNIFPFYFNISQRTALENALTNSISVIEGPPGTGKTQTILNILANLVAVQGKSVAVVSNNNEAVINVIEKLTKGGYGFLTAFLGNNDNQNAFFQNLPIPNVEGWECDETYQELTSQVEALNHTLTKLLFAQRECAQLDQQLRAWKLEQEHFEEYFAQQNIDAMETLPLWSESPDKILTFLAETNLAHEFGRENKLLFRIKLLFKFGILRYKKLAQNELRLVLSLQRTYYARSIQDLETQVQTLNQQLKEANFKQLQEEHKQCSEKLFRKYLHNRYSGMPTAQFERSFYKGKYDEFLQYYPIILSTTHSLRRSMPENYLLDYVIIDEASMVDLITASLVFSCCKNIIVVGDTRQLPQITNKGILSKLQTTPPHQAFNYFEHNILSSILSLYKENLPHVTLREHYRCHPQIIEFCNQKYYAGKLIPLTKPSQRDTPLLLYRTPEGNHMREVTWGENKGRYNLREIDTILYEALHNPAEVQETETIGFATPLRKQANTAANLLPGNIQSDTVHKYQGREKQTMILSTVLDSTWQGRRLLHFVDDPQLINVAVSRAIQQFILVTDHDLFYRNGEHIGDLIRYIQYSTLDENVIESQVVSVFDLLYKQYASCLQPLKAKMNSRARFQSEEALRVLLEDILEQPGYNRYTYTQGVLLRNLLADTKLLTQEEERYVVNRASLDFVVFYKQDKTCALVIEVDGFAFHENNPKQLQRDALKNAILQKYGIEYVRLATNGSGERQEIEARLAH